MKTIIIGIFTFLSFCSIGQIETKLTTSRKDFPLQAVVNLDVQNVLYKGQDYTFSITSSGDYDLRVTAKNAQIKLIEDSKKGTGGLRYTVTPIDTGECQIHVGNVIDEKRSVSLVMYFYKVINYPMPPLQLNEFQSGQIISQLSDSTELKCAYPKESGVFESYEIKSWEVEIGDKTFTGKGNFLSNELIQFVNQKENEFLHIKVNLFKNRTGYSISEGIYLIRQIEKKK